MTRFARAKGSKASNERVPEESTPWHVLKQQLESSVTNEKEQKQKTKSAKELLEEKEESLYYPSLDNTNTDWAEFEDVKKATKHKSDSLPDTSPKKKIKKHEATVNAKEDELVEKSNSFSESKENNNHQDKKKMKKKKRAEKRKNKNSQLENDGNVNSVNKSSDQDTVSQDESKKPSVILSKRQKRNRKNKNKTNNNTEEKGAETNKKDNDETSGMFNVEGNDWKNNLKFGKSDKSSEENEVKDNTDDKQPDLTDKVHEKKPFDKSHRNNFRTNNFRSNDNRFNNNTKMIKKRKPPKIRDDKEHKRRKPDPGASKVIINGMEIEIVLYDGFPVKKEDADRLKELREKMVMKGIPKSDIDAAMKLERRKAEKALTRVKKNVCFHCRKAGHVLSDCPELGREEAATGICFKCGSTEHTHFECKVNKKEEFRFATCFICREQGHIAKQCPDNPKGLYPQGGACKICGDVTHLKKDCPDLVKEKEDNTLTLDTIRDNAIESLDGAEEIKKPENISKTKNKIVKF
ncbi:probable ATP-dependent helicase PF08_0048 [Chelonus insularis]|uniref:probable ATP-dependent helicase PF08_0048 n=1 Tax=Chelonus insularis TaxID=460826 RepID=UPI00158946FF|nr:probable ATP-dependent helicase PF08_0048 [Chelonus insularis]